MSVGVAHAPYNPHRIVNPSPFWPFARCGCCGKPTLYPCGCCGRCAEEANRPPEEVTDA